MRAFSRRYFGIVALDGCGGASHFAAFSKLGERLLRECDVRRRDADEIAVADDDHAVDRLRRREIDVGQLRPYDGGRSILP
jgi:hypothetical protein